VEDVVADLHVLQDLGHRETGRADHPRGREQGEEEYGTAAELEAALGLDDLADVRRITLAAGVDHALADRVELDAEHLDVFGGEVRDLVVAGLLLDDRHMRLFSFNSGSERVSGRGGRGLPPR
jgi:hypothetical protein